ncbi:MAG: glutathione transferase GstA [Alphaproteobacteria bacterium]
MPSDYRLHYAPDNASVIVRLVLLELGQEFDDVLVDRRQQAQQSPEYLKLNPAGLIPALETPAGPIFETGAILLWLSEVHGAMAPAPGSKDRAAFLKWLFYVANTLHPNLRMHFYPAKYIDSHQTELQSGCQANLTHSLELLNDLAGSGQPWLNGTVPSILDFYLAACLRWMALYTTQDKDWFTLTDWPNLHALCAKLENRPSVQSALYIEGYAAQPFTNPQPVTPPQGVAL